MINLDWLVTIKNVGGTLLKNTISIPGFISGILGSFFAPWAKWKFKVLAQKRQNRKYKIESHRNTLNGIMIRMRMYNCLPSHIFSIFYEMSKELEAYLSSVEKSEWIKLSDAIKAYREKEKNYSNPSFLMEFNDIGLKCYDLFCNILNRLERKWDLI